MKTLSQVLTIQVAAVAVANAFRPVGYLDSAIAGWAADQDTPTLPVTVIIALDGVDVGTTQTGLSRPDVPLSSEYPWAGPNTGFSFAIPDAYNDGRDHPVDAYALDVDGTRVSLGSKTYNSGTPPSNGSVISVDPNVGFPGGPLSRSVTIQSSVPGTRYSSGQILNTDGTGAGANWEIVVQDAQFKFFKWHEASHGGVAPTVFPYGGPTNAPCCFDWSGVAVGTLTMRNCWFEDCPMPVLTSRYVTNVIVDGCEFVNCGSTDNPSTHGIYAHPTNTLTVKNSRFRWTYTVPQGVLPIPSAEPYRADDCWIGTGHAIKSRAPRTVVDTCFIDNRNGSMSELIDVGEAGDLTVINSTLLEGKWSGCDAEDYDPITYPGRGYPSDDKLIGYIHSDVDGTCENPGGIVRINNNVIGNYGQPTERIFKVGGVQPASADISGNIIFGKFADAASYPNNQFFPDDSVFVDPDSGDFRLKPSTPTTGSKPAWLTGLPIAQWTPVPGLPPLSQVSFPCMSGQNFGPLSAITNYSGGAVRNAGSVFLLKGGGHASTLNNIFIGIRLSADQPAWEVISPCTSAAQIQNPYNAEGFYLDGKMCAGHSAYKDWFIQSTDTYVQFGSGVSYTGAGGCAEINSFDFSQRGSTDPLKGWSRHPINVTNKIYGDPNWVVGDILYTSDGVAVSAGRLSDANLTPQGNFRGGIYDERYGACFVDTKRGNPVWGGMLDPVWGGSQLLYRIGASALSIVGAPVPYHVYGGGVYVPFSDRYLLLATGHSEMYSINPDSGQCSVVSTTGTLGWPIKQSTVLGRFQYLPELESVVFQEASDDGYQGRLMICRLR